VRGVDDISVAAQKGEKHLPDGSVIVHDEHAFLGHGAGVFHFTPELSKVQRNHGDRFVRRNM